MEDRGLPARPDQPSHRGVEAAGQAASGEAEEAGEGVSVDEAIARLWAHADAALPRPLAPSCHSGAGSQPDFADPFLEDSEAAFTPGLAEHGPEAAAASGAAGPAARVVLEVPSPSPSGGRGKSSQEPPGELSVDSDKSSGKEEGRGGSGTPAGRKKKPPAFTRHPWTEEEEARFRIAMEMFGPKERGMASQGRIPVGLGTGVARSMAAFIGTRSIQQVRSHAQKHFIKLVGASSAAASPDGERLQPSAAAQARGGSPGDQDGRVGAFRDHARAQAAGGSSSCVSPPGEASASTNRRQADRASASTGRLGHARGEDRDRG